MLWPETTTFLSHKGAYSRLKAATVICGQRPQGHCDLFIAGDGNKLQIPATAETDVHYTLDMQQAK